ncbi:2'-5' RNA ligase family protein [Neobacillus terrae]|uniref:2'-5' RNA ligase family protein n=1 Tax=Neobacillus terrae TaxID=3034837 RepID=UPI001408DDC0|nr:2'-5' RNA ligase family protein [Neobacillus terrae]NHM30826.1 2'-5' RNA ligase family protein [Neobacillus terrae]
MYGFIAIFDGQTEQTIKDIWGELTEKNISHYSYEVENRRPHITLASYNNIKIIDFIDKMDEFYKYKPSIDVTFNTIGSFLKSGALFLSPAVTKELLEFHLNHHKSFERFNNYPNSLYLPDNWIPHCTIANRLASEKLSEAFNYCSNRTGILYGKIKEVALIDVSIKNKAPIIYSKVLTDK